MRIADTIERRFHFISGLPRAGSTLLAAILQQNPRFRAGMSSPVGTLFSGILNQLAAGSEFGSVVDEPARRRLLSGLFESYYAEAGSDTTIFDTNRMWCAKLPALQALFPEARVLCCVRNVAWVMDSLERAFRSNPFENTRLFASETERSTVYSRVDTLAQRDRLVGFAWSALKEAYYGEHARLTLLVDYEMLAQMPERVMRLVYDFLEEPWFEHDFQNVQYDASAFDAGLGLSGLHKVRPTVSLESRRTILPPDLFDKYSKLSFWEDGTGSAANVIRARPAQAKEA